MAKNRSVLSFRANGREVQADLHGYATETALRFAEEVVEAAWERGAARVALVHGAKHVASPAASDATGQGATKWALRRALSRGAFNRWAEPPKSSAHARGGVSDRLVVALKPNPRPDPGAPLPDPPPHEYDRTRRRA
ncbi:MAG: hypothetical protein RRA92_03340 [Gemmatimonadota bacterium]|nr:hypothetical protein [Gemmatimonadota bacterium]